MRTFFVQYEDLAPRTIVELNRFVLACRGSVFMLSFFMKTAIQTILTRPENSAGAVPCDAVPFLPGPSHVVDEALAAIVVVERPADP